MHAHICAYIHTHSYMSAHIHTNHMHTIYNNNNNNNNKNKNKNNNNKNNNNNNPYIWCLINWMRPFLRDFTWYIIIAPAQAKHCGIPLWGWATSSHLNSLGSIQTTRLPLGTVNLFRMHTILPLTIIVRYQFYTLVRWDTYGVHILPKDVT